MFDWLAPRCMALTFDERRSRPITCPCGRHWITGGEPLYCPWAPVHVPGRAGAIWAQPDWECGE
jgi:hypothetical protein